MTMDCLVKPDNDICYKPLMASNACFTKILPASGAKADTDGSCPLNLHPTGGVITAFAIPALNIDVGNDKTHLSVDREFFIHK